MVSHQPIPLVSLSTGDFLIEGFSLAQLCTYPCLSAIEPSDIVGWMPLQLERIVASLLLQLLQLGLEHFLRIKLPQLSKERRGVDSGLGERDLRMGTIAAYSAVTVGVAVGMRVSIGLDLRHLEQCIL